MRPPPRAVADYDVDRAQVQRRRRQSRALLIARELLARVTHAPCRRAFVRAAPAALPAALCERCAPVRPVLGHGLIGGKAYPGGHCAGVPPLPIPNREVKPGCADGTAQQCGRVGGRRLFVDMVPVWPSGRTGTFFLWLGVMGELGVLGELWAMGGLGVFSCLFVRC